MKHNSKQFLALFMAVSMAVAPVSGVYAEDQNAAVEDTLSENKQDNDEAGQTEPEPPHRRNQSAKMKYLRTLLISAVWQVL